MSSIHPNRPLELSTRTRDRVGAVIILVAAAGVLYRAAFEFYNMAWGTGSWMGEFSAKWVLAFALFVLFCLVVIIGLGLALLSAPLRTSLASRLISVRQRLGLARWLLIALFVAAPIWFLQYSPWGVAVDKAGLRLTIWSVSAIATGLLLVEDAQRAWTWSAGLSAGLLTGGAFVVAQAFSDVTSFPFSLSWSEGNRLWDYSLLFGKRLYTYQPGPEPVAYLDIGRQLLGGVPFLFRGVSIFAERFWLGVLAILPFLLLGLLAFWPTKAHVSGAWLLAGIWSVMFLNQGPIHPPLVICAIMVAIAWRRPAWLAVPLLASSGYFAEISRFTWMFAPAIWAVMLTLGDATPQGQRLPSVSWRRAILLGLAGLLGSAIGIVWGLTTAGTSLGTATAASTKQSLLLYRLLPNATYGTGIIVGLLIAAGPLVILLVVLGLRHAKLNSVQRIVILAPLVAFLAVGLIVSTKIGGGGDLHNLDMFLIGLLFVGALEWRLGGEALLSDLRRPTILLGAALILTAAIPAYQALMALRPLSFAQDATWLAVLADAQRPRDLGSLPSAEVVGSSLKELQVEIRRAQPQGQILFMDQRQLLTFSYLGNVSLVPDYEKKRMMDEALSRNAAYFDAFYRDLAAHRFSLIVSSPLRTPIKDSEYGFGEENNAWVEWVSKPVLCYYQELDTLVEVKVELLVPRTDPTQCSLPVP